MANWDNAASNHFREIKNVFNATDAQMDNLRQQINTWANANPDGTGYFPFMNTQVSVRTIGGSDQTRRLRKLGAVES